MFKLLLAVAGDYGWRQFIAAVAWPLVAVVALGCAVFAMRVYGVPESVRDIAKRLKRVKVLQVEVELGEEVSKRAKETLEEAFQRYRLLIKTTMDHGVRKYQIDEKFRAAVKEHIRPIVEGNASAGSDYRYTIYVKDLLFADGLYQLVDYYPQGTGRGRAFSLRYGIIGRVWRSETSISQNVDPDPHKLIIEWGMTYQQAFRAGSGRESFAAVVIRDSGEVPRAILFMDARPPDAFPALNDLETVVTNAFTVTRLTEALTMLAGDTRGQAPEIVIYQDA